MKKGILSTLLLGGASMLLTALAGILSDKKSEVQMKEEVSKEVERQLEAREAKEEDTEES